MSNNFINSNDAQYLLSTLSEEFIKIKNPDYIHPAFDIVPIATKINSNTDRLVAAVMDMDGTTTTTELLCIHSLELMVRRMSGLLSKEDWTGLNPKEDYPHIIGNSTTKHIEYLLNKYINLISNDRAYKSFMSAAAWTIKFSKDERRKSEVLINIKTFVQDDDLIDDLISNGKNDIKNFMQSAMEEIKNKSEHFDPKLSFVELVKMGIDIYYQRYHEILERIKAGESNILSNEIFGTTKEKLIHPMPGAAFFLSLTKGWLSDEAADLTENLLSNYKEKKGEERVYQDIDIIKQKIKKLGIFFEKNPIKISIVTSSIFYEADIVMNEVCKVIKEEINSWNISELRKKFLLDKFTHYSNIYDAFITASDSSEIRLKPHRDLYSIALHQLNISKKDFDKVLGFEDSESGTIAIRAAGIGRCIAVPFHETSGHNLSAASYISTGGLPEVILDKNIFINY